MKMNNNSQIELIKEKCLQNRIKNEYKELENIYSNTQ